MKKSVKKSIKKKIAKKPAKKSKPAKGSIKLATKDMTIDKILMLNPKKSPEIAGLLFMGGMHCVGCGVAQFETFEQGCLAHGMSKQNIEKLLTQINKILKE